MHFGILGAVSLLRAILQPEQLRAEICEAPPSYELRSAGALL